MASRLLRRQVMTLTDAAAARVRELTEAAGKPIAGLRVGVRNGGCAGMSYTMELAEDVSPLDEVVEDKGVKLLIDPKAVLFRLGDGLQGRPAVRHVLFPQSQRDLRLRLRRERRHHPGEARGAERARVSR
jgi:iron-sulfur cluster assembly accessory protein